MVVVLRCFLVPIFFIVGGGAIIAGLGVWGYQALTWLQLAELPEVPLMLAWVTFIGDVPEFTWNGVQQIFSWILLQNAGLGALLFGIVSILLGSFEWSRLESSRKDTETASELVETPPDSEPKAFQ